MISDYILVFVEKVSSYIAFIAQMRIIRSSFKEHRITDEAAVTLDSRGCSA